MKTSKRLSMCVCLAAVLAPAHASSIDSVANLSLEELLQVRVTGASKYEQSLHAVAANVTVITREQIARFGWTTLEQALATLPGVYTTEDRQYSYVGVRGLGLPGDYSTRILITVNGNRLNEPVYDAAPSGYAVPVAMESLERIEFLPGPGGAVYGQNAMFAVINLVTRQTSNQGSAQAWLHTDPRERRRHAVAHWDTPLPGGATLSASIGRLRAKGQDLQVAFGPDYGVLPVRNQDGERADTLFLGLRWNAWSFDLTSASRNKASPLGAFGSDPGAPGQGQTDQNSQAQLRWSQAFSDITLTGRLFGGAMGYKSDLLFGGERELTTTRGRWLGLETQALLTGWLHHTVMLGFETQQNLHQGWNRQTVGDPTSLQVFNGRGYNSGVYVQDDWQLLPALNAVLGLRVNRASTYGTGGRSHTQVSPRLGLIWQASSTSTHKLLAGRAHRAPNLYERFYSDSAQLPQPELAGEQVDSYEWASQYRITPQLQLRTSLYRWDLRRIITLTDTDDGQNTQFQSGAPIAARGFEMAADYVGASGINLRGRFSGHRLAQSGGTQLLNSPRWLAGLAVSAPLPWSAAQASAEWAYNGPRYALDGGRTRAYALLSLRVSVARGLGGVPGLGAAVSVHNALDKAYEQPAAPGEWRTRNSQDGRSVRASLSYGF
jgi:outer membrane receptor protein involved in Fe transport